MPMWTPGIHCCHHSPYLKFLYRAWCRPVLVPVSQPVLDPDPPPLPLSLSPLSSPPIQPPSRYETTPTSAINHHRPTSPTTSSPPSNLSSRAPHLYQPTPPSTLGRNPQLRGSPRLAFPTPPRHRHLIDKIHYRDDQINRPCLLRNIQRCLPITQQRTIRTTSQDIF